MSGRIDRFNFCPNCFASSDSIAELPSSDNDFLCTACNQELFLDVPYTECYEAEIKKLKKALEVSEKLVNLACHIRTHTEADIVEEYAREAQKQIKDIMEGK